MSVAKNMLLRGHIAMRELAQRVGYGSVSAFSMAFHGMSEYLPSLSPRNARSRKSPSNRFSPDNRNAADGSYRSMTTGGSFYEIRFWL